MTKNIEYVPEQQDLVWIDFQPSKGNELRGRHPAVVLSASGYTRMTGLVAVSPVTHGINNRLKEMFVPVITNFGIDGYVNPLQFHTFSVVSRNVEYAGGILDDSAFAMVMKTHQQLLNIY
ncbi:type II toxin-antitoxin system PemK/MazF family toxin [Weissella cibaria]|uniref:type II toxin-antitoxin system PemK/MazF family toxin n=1 Tax=Weissella cibaria TaxID=137591 RepID=UPI00106DDF21|nr:type II toxin-antitoxin system PemK/MazF family toxin [Weissella cibaria]